MSEEKRFDDEPVVNILAHLARDKVYGPLDLLSRVEDNDEFYMKMAREALYMALRYVSTEGQSYERLEDSVKSVLALIEKRPQYAKELALKALAKAMSTQTQAQSGQKPAGTGE
jgi:3-polyprenyl-4-hydroxybenzoate decarboxylase